MSLVATRADVQGLVDQGAQLVDVLAPAEYADDHLPGAINLPLKQLAEIAPERLERDCPVVVYCHDTI